MLKKTQVTCVLSLTICIAVGCQVGIVPPPAEPAENHQGVDAKHAAANPAGPAATEDTHDATRPIDVSARRRQPGQGGASAEDAEQQPQNPLIRGVNKLLEASDVIEEKSELTEMLLEADESLSRVKAENREALRQVNRQVRLRGPQSPNIVLIVVEQLGYGDLGCYGQEQIDTPNINRLAAEGARFESFYAGSPDGSTTRLCLLTGLTASHAGNGTSDAFKLRENDFNLAEILWRAGYTTAVVGLWGVPVDSKADIPTNHGYEEWFGLFDRAEAADPYPERLWSNFTQVRVTANKNEKRGQYVGDLLLHQAKSFLTRRGRERPFFLHVSYPKHRPIDELWKGTPFEAKDWPEAQKNHAARISRLDSDVGAILSHLERLGLAENTAVFLTSDSAPEFHSPTRPDVLNSFGGLRAESCDLYEGRLRIPLLVRWPGRVAKGMVIESVGAVWDLMPTMVEMVSAIRRPRGMRGISLVNVLRGNSAQQRELLYWESQNDGLAQAVRFGKWKGLRRAGTNTIELYDLESDTGETTDVADQHPDIVAAMQRPQVSSENN